MTPLPSTIHASAVLSGDRAILIRGPSGSGKSRLAFDLILAGRAGQIPAAVLVGDDRIALEVRQGQVIASPAPALAGLIEIRGLGIRRMDFTAQAAVGLIVDLHADDTERLPPPQARRVVIMGVEVPRIAVGTDMAPLALVAAFLTTTEGYADMPLRDDCPKGIGNHITPTLSAD